MPQPEDSSPPGRPGQGPAQLTALYLNARVPVRTLEGPLVVFGRAPGCNVVLASSDVAPTHAILLRRPDGWHLADAGGCGVRVNGAAIDWRRLEPRDEIGIARFRFRFRAAPAADAPPAPSPHMVLMNIRGGPRIESARPLLRFGTTAGCEVRTGAPANGDSGPAALLAWTEDGPILRRLSKAVAVACNGQPIDERRLSIGDLVRVGDDEWTFSVATPADAPAAAAQVAGRAPPRTIAIPTPAGAGGPIAVIVASGFTATAPPGADSAAAPGARPAGESLQPPSAVRLAESTERTRPLLAARLPQDQRPRLSVDSPASHAIEQRMTEFDEQLARDVDRLERAQEQVAWAASRGAAPFDATAATPSPSVGTADTARNLMDQPIDPPMDRGPSAFAPQLRRAAPHLAEAGAQRALRAELESQRVALQAREEALLARAAEIEQREREWRSIDESTASREDDLRRREAELNSAADELEAARRQLERTRQIAAEDEQRLAERTRLLADMQAALDLARQRADADAARAASQSGSLDGRAAELERAAGDLASLRRMLQRRRARLRQARRGRRALRQREYDEFRAGLQREAERVQAALQAELSRRESELEAAGAALRTAQEELHRRSAELDAAGEVARLEIDAAREAARLEAGHLADLRAEAEAEREQLAERERNATELHTSLAERADELDAAVRNAAQRAAELNDRAAMLDERERALIASEREQQSQRERADAERETARAADAEYERREAALHERAAQLNHREHELAETQRRTEQQHAEALRLGDDAAARRAEVAEYEADFTRRADAARAELESQAADVQRRRSDPEGLRQSLADADQLRSERADRADELAEQCARLEARAAQLQQQIDELDALAAERRIAVELAETELAARHAAREQAAHRAAEPVAAPATGEAQAPADGTHAEQAGADDTASEVAAVSDTLRQLAEQEARLRGRILEYEAEVGALLRQREQAAGDPARDATADDAPPDDPDASILDAAAIELQRRFDELDAAERDLAERREAFEREWTERSDAADQRELWMTGEQERLAQERGALDQREREWAGQYQRESAELEARRLAAPDAIVPGEVNADATDRDTGRLPAAAPGAALDSSFLGADPAEAPTTVEAPTESARAVPVSRAAFGVGRAAVASVALLTLAAGAAGYFLPTAPTAVVCDLVIQAPTGELSTALLGHQAALLGPRSLREAAVAAGVSPDFFEQLGLAGQLTCRPDPAAGRLQARLELPAGREQDGMRWLEKLTTTYGDRWSRELQSTADPSAQLSSTRARIALELADAERTLAAARQARAANPAADELRDLNARLDELQIEYQLAKSDAENAAHSWAAIQDEQPAGSDAVPAAELAAALEHDAVYQADAQEARARAEFVAAELATADDMLRPLLGATSQTCTNCLADVREAAPETADERLRPAAARISAALSAYGGAAAAFGRVWQESMERLRTAAGEPRAILGAQSDAGAEAERFAVAARKQIAEIRDAIDGLVSAAPSDQFARLSALQAEWTTAIRPLQEHHRDLMFAAAGASTNANHRLDAAARTAAAMLERTSQRQDQIRESLAQQARQQQADRQVSRIAAARQAVTEAAARRQKLADKLAELQGRAAQLAAAANVASGPGQDEIAADAEVQRLRQDLAALDRQLAAAPPATATRDPATRITVTRPRPDVAMESQRLARGATFGGAVGVPAMALLLLLAAFGRRGTLQAG